MNSKQARQAYQEVNTYARADETDPYRIIQMLMEGAIEKMSLAKGCLIRNDVEGKGKNLSLAISIIDGLQASLDIENGGEISNNLKRLYEHMMDSLVEANLYNKPEIIDQVIQLMSTIKNGWDGIEGEVHRNEQ